MTFVNVLCAAGLAIMAFVCVGMIILGIMAVISHETAKRSPDNEITDPALRKACGLPPIGDKTTKDSANEDRRQNDLSL